MISDKLKGTVVPEETRIKIATKIRKAHKIGVYGKEYRNKLSIASTKLACKGKLWAQSDKARKILSELLSKRNQQGLMRIESKKLPTKPEKFIKDNFKNVLKYTGNSAFWVTSKGQHKNPDFVHVNPKVKKIVEVFGDYWHAPKEKKQIITLYKAIGWQCHVVWESHIKLNPKKVIKDLQLFLER